MDWERRNQKADSKTPSQMKRTEVDTMDPQRDSPIGRTHSQVTSAQVETYQMKTFVGESQPRVDHRDSITSPGAGAVANRLHPINNNVHEADRARARQDGLNSGKYSHLLILIPLYI